MPHIPYKYTIQSKLARLNYDDYTIAKKFLPRVCGVSWETFKKWIYRKADNAAEIPSEAILKMAVFFECEPKEMYTDTNFIQKVVIEFKKFRESNYPERTESLKFRQTND